MADILTRGTMFPKEVAEKMYSLVKGHSSLAKLAAQEPVPFNGKDIFTFTLDKEVDIVAENGAKTKGGATVAPVSMVPIKFEYGARVSDEFLYGSEEYKLDVLQQFADGFAAKLARGLDIAAMHGLNPRTATASAIVGNNNLDYITTSNAVTYVAASADDNIDAAIALCDGNVNGIAMSKVMRSAIAALVANGARKYPEFAFGGAPSNLGASKLDVNDTITFNSSDARAYVGDFSAFRWGYAKNMPLKVIEFGNPDNDATLGDLQGHNQVYLRSEAYIAWAFLDPARFAVVKA